MIEQLSLLSFASGGWGQALLAGALVTISLALACLPIGLPLGLGVAQRRGGVPVDGLGMLRHPAVPGFARWFGVTPTVTIWVIGWPVSVVPVAPPSEPGPGMVTRAAAIAITMTGAITSTTRNTTSTASTDGMTTDAAAS